MREALSSQSTDSQSLEDIQVQIADLSALLVRYRGQAHQLQEDNRILRIRLSVLEDRVSVLESQDHSELRRLQRRVLPGDYALGCLTTRVLHLGSCFQHLVAALQRAFPRSPGFWQSLEEP